LIIYKKTKNYRKPQVENLDKNKLKITTRSKKHVYIVFLSDIFTT